MCGSVFSVFQFLKWLKLRVFLCVKYVKCVKNKLQVPHKIVHKSLKWYLKCGIKNMHIFYKISSNKQTKKLDGSSNLVC